MSGENDFFFLQLSDTHWGFSDPAVNPDFTGTLKKAVASVNSLKVKPIDLSDALDLRILHAANSYHLLSAFTDTPVSPQFIKHSSFG